MSLLSTILWSVGLFYAALIVPFLAYAAWHAACTLLQRQKGEQATGKKTMLTANSNNNNSGNSYHVRVSPTTKRIRVQSYASSSSGGAEDERPSATLALETSPRVEPPSSSPSLPSSAPIAFDVPSASSAAVVSTLLASRSAASSGSSRGGRRPIIMRLNSNECSAAIPSPLPSAGGDTSGSAAVTSIVQLQCSNTLSASLRDVQADDDDSPLSASAVDDADCVSVCSDDSEDAAEMAALEAYFTTTTPSVPLAASRLLQSTSSSSAAASMQGRQRQGHGAPPLSPQPIVPTHVRSLVIPASPALLSSHSSSVENSRPSSSSGEPQHPPSALLHARLTVLPSAPPTPEQAPAAGAERSFAAHFHLAAESGRYSAFPTAPPASSSSSGAASAASAAAAAAAASAAAASTVASVVRATVFQQQQLSEHPQDGSLRGAIETATAPLHRHRPAVASAAGTANHSTVAPFVVAQRLPSAAATSSVATSTAAATATAAAQSLSSNNAAALVAVSPAAAPVLTTAPALAQSLFQQRLNAAAALASATAAAATSAAGVGAHTDTHLLPAVTAVPVSV
jgi:hypothetical protein